MQLPMEVLCTNVQLSKILWVQQSQQSALFDDCSSGVCWGSDLGCEFVRRSAKCEVEFAQIIAIIWINLTSSLRQKSLGRSKSRRTWAVELTRSEVTKWFYRVFVPKVAVCKILPIGIHTSNFWSPKLEVSFHENPSDRINDQISTAGILAFSQIIRLGARDFIKQTHSLRYWA